MGLRSLSLRSYSIDTLIAGGVLGAILISVLQLSRGSTTVHFDAAAMLLVLRLTGQWIETRVRANSIDSPIELESEATEKEWTASGRATVPLTQIKDGAKVPIGRAA